MMHTRAHFVGIIVISLSAAIIVRVWYLQVLEKDFLQSEGDKRTIRIERIEANRGIIQDRKGKPLAVSTPVLSLWYNPSEVLKSDDRLEPLTTYLGVEAADFDRRLKNAKSKGFVYLRRHLPPAEVREILELKIPGIYSKREYKRFYPAGEVAAHIVGFTDVNDKGLEGVELSFDKWLTGRAGERRVLKNLHHEIIRDIKPVAEAQRGRTLTLGIDLRLQYLAYQELKSAVTSFQAESGSVIVLDVESGQVLAMVNQPSYNPNNRVGLKLSAVRNRALTDAYEPGSTVKPFVVGVALQSESYTPQSIIDTTPGFLRVGNFTIRDPLNLGQITLGETIMHSSQVGISRLALGLDEYEVRAMFEKLGFGRDAGTGFPGESAGHLPNHRRWTDIERAAFAYGYGLTVTPLQLAASYLTIASGGIKRDISLIVGAEGNDQRIYSREVADQLKEILASVVAKGTAKKAAIQGYSVAGKTGTARKMGESGYEDTRHLAFFAGMAPVDHPRLVCVVLINEPKGESYGGGATAAPVFSRVMQNALRFLNVPPEPQVKGGAA
jgi:cell division protein FtsI (penicillin-binding protein 3)